MSKIVNVDVDDKTHENLARLGQFDNRSMRFVARDILRKGTEARMRRAKLAIKSRKP